MSEMTILFHNASASSPVQRVGLLIDQPDVIKKILQDLGLWEEFHAAPARDPPVKEITFDPSYSQVI
jgi:hypothetical protein